MTEDEHNGMSWHEWHIEWTGFMAEQRERDEKLRDALAEVLDSLGAMHTMFESLPCAENKLKLEHLAIDVAALQARGLLLRKAAEALQPVVRPRLLVGAMGLMAAILGWDWWQRIDAAIQKVLR